MAKVDLETLRPLERNRLYEDLVERLGQFVADSRMGIGDRFPAERDLASGLGVSRTSLRQAMVVLQALGYVDIKHGEGVFLRRSRGFGESLSKLAERRRLLPAVHEARQALELKLAELAAARRTAADVKVMTRALEQMESDVKSGGLGIQGDTDFHRAIAHAARNVVLEKVMDELAGAIHESRLESLSEPGRPAMSMAGHRQILAAIGAGDPAAARDAMAAHLQVVADVSLLRWQPEAGVEG